MLLAQTLDGQRCIFLKQLANDLGLGVSILHQSNLRLGLIGT